MACGDTRVCHATRPNASDVSAACVFAQLLSLRIESIEHSLNTIRGGTGASGAEVADLVEKLPQVSAEIASPATEIALLTGRVCHVHVWQVLGLSSESNLRPKLAFLRSNLGLSELELRTALLREPAVLGTSLERSLRPNLKLWRAALPKGVQLPEVVAERGLRWLTPNAAKRTQPRLRRAAEAGLPAESLLTRMRLTDAQFEAWVVRESSQPAAAPRIKEPTLAASG